MKNRNIVFSMLIMILISLNYISLAQTLDSVNANTEAVTKGIEPAKTAEEMKSQSQDPLQACQQTAEESVKECRKPSGGGFQKAMAVATALPAVASQFMSGDISSTDDPEAKEKQQRQMQKMCQLTSLMKALGDMLNGNQGETCTNAVAACEQKCGDSLKELNKREVDARNRRDIQAADNYRRQAEFVQQAEKECTDEAEKVAQAAQQQQQQNQSSGEGSDACQQALGDGLEKEEPVDCQNPKFASKPECSTLAKTGDGLPEFDRSAVDLGSLGDQSEADFPNDDSDPNFWDNLRNKAAGGGGNGNGGGAGGLGSLGAGGGGAGNGSDNGSRGASSKTGAGVLSGGDASGSGGGSWGSGSKDGFGSRFSGLRKKKDKLNMLNKRKLAGHKLGAGSEFGLSSDDIWTRVYLRTNTRCTKELKSCSANKSENPYGFKK